MHVYNIDENIKDTFEAHEIQWKDNTTKTLLIDSDGNPLNSNMLLIKKTDFNNYILSHISCLNSD